MFRRTFIVFYASLFLNLVLPVVAAVSEFAELAKTAKPAVILLSILDHRGKEVGTGTGFFISADGRIVTNFHVIEGAERMEGTLSDGRKIAIDGVLAEDEVNDVAILQGPKPAAGQVLPLTNPSEPKVEPGERVYVIGAPNGLSGSLSEGIVSAIRSAKDLEKFGSGKKKDRIPLLQITAPISHGSSGSPVLDGRGQVIGVAVSTLEGGQNLNFAVPVSIVHKLLTEIKPEAGPRVLSKRGAGWNVLISCIFFAGLYWGYRRLAYRRG